MRTIVIASKPGQLGNLLVVYANFIAYAKENESVILNPAFEQYAHLFSSTLNSALCRYPVRKSAQVSARKRRWLYQFFSFVAKILQKLKIENTVIRSISLDWNEQLELEKLSLMKSRFIIVQGWQFRSDILVRKHQNIIRDHFSLAESHKKNVEAFLRDAKTSWDILIGIHIRHGDYKVFEGGKYFYELSEYQKIMQRTHSFFLDKKILFCICSNVPIESDSFSDLDWRSGPGDVAEDLYTLAGCDFIIGPPSTFSIWASFYGNVPLYQIERSGANFELSDFNIFDSL